MRATVAVLRSIGYAATLSVVSDRAYRAALASPGSRPAAGVASVEAQVAAPWALPGSVAAGSGARLGTWTAISRAIARRADAFVIGDLRIPRFSSARVDTAAMRLDPEYGLDVASLRLR
jgi:hypothetical protein